MIGGLAARDAQNLVVLNVPDLDKTPGNRPRTGSGAARYRGPAVHCSCCDQVCRLAATGTSVSGSLVMQSPRVYPEPAHRSAASRYRGRQIGTGRSRHREFPGDRSGAITITLLKQLWRGSCEPRFLYLASKRGGRLGLNSVSVPIDGLPTNPFHRLPLRDIAQGGRSPTGALSRNGGEFHAAADTARPAKYT